MTRCDRLSTPGGLLVRATMRLIGPNAVIRRVAPLFLWGVDGPSGWTRVVLGSFSATTRPLGSACTGPPSCQVPTNSSCVKSPSSSQMSRLGGNMVSMELDCDLSESRVT